MSEIKLSSKLPGGDANGIARIAGELVKTPHKVQVLIALVDSQKSIADHDTGDVIPVVRIRRVEVVHRADLQEAERLLRRALELRTGQVTLDIELEDEISSIFKDIDLADPGLYTDETKSDDHAEDDTDE